MEIKPSLSWPVACFFLVLLLAFYILPLDQRLYSLGDDFAQYLQHAQNICQGRPYTELPYLYNAEALNGPPAYPPIYPLLISPLACNHPPPYLWIKVISVLLFFLSLPLLYQIFLSQGDVPLARTTIFLYPLLPWVVYWGRDIGSDTPYTFFSILGLWCLMTLPQDRLAAFRGLLTGFCMALAALTRDIGLALWVGSVLFFAFRFWKNRPQRSVTFLQLLILSAAFLLPVILWNLFQQRMGLEPVNKAYFQFSLGLNGLAFQGLLVRLVSNFYYYLQKSYELLFPLSTLRPVPYLNWIRLPLAAVLLSILLWQIIKGLRGAALPIILYMGCFLGVLLILDFPMRAGVRYILPLAPFLIYFLLRGINDLGHRYGRLSYRPLVRLFLIFWIAMSLWGSTTFVLLIKSPDFTSASPEKPPYQDLVSWIQQKLPLDCRIAYIKPRYLSYTSHRPTVIPTLSKPPIQILNQLSRWQVTHVLLDDNFIQEETFLRKTVNQYPEFFSPLYVTRPLYLFSFHRPSSLSGGIPPLSKEN